MKIYVCKLSFMYNTLNWGNLGDHQSRRHYGMGMSDYIPSACAIVA